MAALLELTKPGITRMVALTAATGFALATRGRFDLLLFAHLLLGTALVASGTNALNQWWERDADALMPRTRRRPLPSGRIAPAAAFGFGVAISLAGITYLALFVNAVTAALAASSLATYVLLYTPLKQRTSLATLVGAVPGALPILGGWTAAGGPVAARGGWLLFAILFLWQIPHFLSLGWMYREDYRAGGFAMLSRDDRDGRVTARLALLYSVVLLGASLVPVPLRLVGEGGLYPGGAAVLGLALVGWSGALLLHPTERRARGLFLASIVYLPALLGLLVVSGT